MATVRPAFFPGASKHPSDALVLWWAMIDIIVNARRRQVAAGELSYEDVVRLALSSLPQTVLTVSYDSDTAAGSLRPGQRVVVRSEMIFNVADTSRA